MLLVAFIAAFASELSALPFQPFTAPNGQHPLDEVLLAVALGMVFRNTMRIAPIFSSGVQFSNRPLLAIAIVLLGSRLDLTGLAEIGLRATLMSIVIVVLTLVFFRYLGRSLGVSRIDAALLGVGTAICGGTAILAIAPIIRASAQRISVCISIITLLGVSLMGILPALGHFTALNHQQFGMWAGLSIHQLSQSISAGFAFSPQAGETATLIKLTRVCLLAPIAVFVSFLENQQRGMDGQLLTAKGIFNLIPKFLFGYVIFAIARTFNLIPSLSFSWTNPLYDGTFSFSIQLEEVIPRIAGFLLTMSMAAIGLETDLQVLRHKSAKLMFLGFAGTVFLAFTSWLFVQQSSAQN